jgi:hypothetical protein
MVGLEMLKLYFSTKSPLATGWPVSQFSLTMAANILACLGLILSDSIMD